jgi:hypothetical protein
VVAEKIAKYMVDFGKMEESIIGDAPGSDDPIVALKNRELDIRETENEREARLEREKMAQKERLEKAKMAQRDRLDKARMAQQGRMNTQRMQAQDKQAALRTSLDLTKMFSTPTRN